MKTRFSFIDPGAIMGVVIALIILGVGTFAFFVTVAQIQSAGMGGRAYGAWTGSEASSVALNQSQQYFSLGANNTTGIGNHVFNIVGVVLIIGAIMSIVGLVYNYVR
jgi:hypothetical protein